MCCLFQIATHEKKAHDNWVRFCPSLYFVRSLQQLSLDIFSSNSSKLVPQKELWLKRKGKLPT